MAVILYGGFALTDAADGTRVTGAVNGDFTKNCYRLDTGAANGTITVTEIAGGDYRWSVTLSADVSTMIDIFHTAGTSYVAGRVNGIQDIWTTEVIANIAAIQAVIPASTIAAATDLSNLDASVSSRLASTSYTAPDNANIGVAATQATNAAASAANIEAVIPGTTIAAASDLANLDTTVSSRLATSGYTAPDNANIAVAATQATNAAADSATAIAEYYPIKTEKPCVLDISNVGSSETYTIGILDREMHKPDASNISSVKFYIYQKRGSASTLLATVTGAYSDGYAEGSYTPTVSDWRAEDVRHVLSEILLTGGRHFPPVTWDQEIVPDSTLATEANATANRTAIVNAIPDVSGLATEDGGRLQDIDDRLPASPASVSDVGAAGWGTSPWYNGTIDADTQSAELVITNGAGEKRSIPAGPDGTKTLSFAAGTYTVEPNKTGYSFSPSSASLVISDGGANSVSFTATELSYSGPSDPAFARVYFRLKKPDGPGSEVTNSVLIIQNATPAGAAGSYAIPTDDAAALTYVSDGIHYADLYVGEDEDHPRYFRVTYAPGKLDGALMKLEYGTSVAEVTIVDGGPKATRINVTKIS